MGGNADVHFGGKTPPGSVRNLHRMCPQPESPNRDAYSALALVGQVGIAAVAPILLGIAGGVYARERLGGTLGTVALFGGIVLGIAGGVAAVYRVIAPYLK